MALPDDNFILVRYLGPSFYIESVLTAKLLLKNGEYIHMSTHHVITEDEIHDPKEIKLQEGFNTAIDRCKTCQAC